MSIRQQLKEREEQRQKPKGDNINDGLPEGVTRYVRLGQELKDGKELVLLADPDNWYFYYCHEASTFGGPTHVRKHTCLHSPRKTGEDFGKFRKSSGKDCISCKAGAPRKLYFMIPVYDPQYKTWRVLDVKEFHANNLISDYDKLEKAARKFNKDYTVVGDIVSLEKADKTYSMGSGDSEVNPDEIATWLDFEIPYSELAYFREEDDIIELLLEADDEYVNKSVLTSAEKSEVEDGAPIDISDDDLPF